MASDEWLIGELEKLSLDAEVYCEYVRGMMEADDSEPLAERAEGVAGMLSAATDVDLAPFQAALVAEYQRATEAAEVSTPPSMKTPEGLKSPLDGATRRRAAFANRSRSFSQLAFLAGTASPRACAGDTARRDAYDANTVPASVRESSASSALSNTW